MANHPLREKLKAQAAEVNGAGDALGRCARPFCGRLSMVAAGVGFDMNLCEYHREKVARHGHPEVPSIRGTELRPYLLTAQRWIKTQLKAGDMRCQYALTGINALMLTAGRAPRADEIKHWSAEQKATAAFARLREAGVRPERILAAHMGIVAILADDTWAPREVDYKLTQIGKAVHRLASGSHRRYQVPVAKVVNEGGGGAPRIIEYDSSTRTVAVHSYPRSQGQVLRVIGRSLDEACGDIAEAQRQAIIAAKEARYGRHPCHDPKGYEPDWRKKERAKHEAARKARQQAQDDANRATAMRRALGLRG